jgi:hypothetical protein
MRVFQDSQGRLNDEEQHWVEDMGLPLNLMLGCSVEIVVGTIEDALLKLKDNSMPTIK